MTAGNRVVMEWIWVDKNSDSVYTYSYCQGYHGECAICIIPFEVT